MHLLLVAMPLLLACNQWAPRSQPGDLSFEPGRLDPPFEDPDIRSEGPLVPGWPMEFRICHPEKLKVEQSPIFSRGSFALPKGLKN